MDERISYLIGAGLSTALGQPSTSEITNVIISERGIQETPNYILRENRFEKETYSKLVLEFLRRLYCFAEDKNTNVCFFSVTEEKIHSVNYEDLFYMLPQLHQHNCGDYNPYGCILSEQINYEQLNDKWKNTPENRNVGNLGTILEDAATYLINTVIRMLKDNHKNIELEKLETVFCRLKNSKNMPVNIFSLNHDTVLEQYFDKYDIRYVDGFAESDGELRKWEPSVFDTESNNRVRLLKLHGSINWRRYKAADDDKVGPPILAKYVGNKDIDNEYTKVLDGSGVNYEPAGHCILIGTENKIESYLSLQFNELHRRFRQYLWQTDRLVVIGYSFGDTGINAQLFEWFQNGYNKKMVVVDKMREVVFVEKLPYMLGEYFKDSRWRKHNDKLKYYDEGVLKTDFGDILG